MTWDVSTARAIAGFPATDTTHDAALRLVMDAVLATVETKLERGLLKRKEAARFHRVDSCRIYLPRYPIERVISPGGLRHVHYRNGWIEGASPGRDGDVEIEWIGGYDPLPADLERALWGAFLAEWANSDPLTGAPTAGAAVLTGSGEMKSLTVYDAYKVDFDVGSTSAGGASAGKVDEAFWGALSPWADILMAYRRNVGGA